MAEPIPGAAADAAPLNYPAINRFWAGILIGLLEPLRFESYWDSQDPLELQNVIDQVEILQLLLMDYVRGKQLLDNDYKLLKDEAGKILIAG